MLNKEKNVAIYYHREDSDGVGSGALIRNMLLDLDYRSSNIDMFGVDHRDMEKISKDADWSEYLKHRDEIYIVDIAFPPEKMKEFSESYEMLEKVTWHDHHTPIIEKSEEMGFDTLRGRRDTSVATVRNIWEFYYKVWNTECPPIIKMVSAMDNWTWKQEGYKLEDIDSFSLGFNKLSDLSVNWWMDNMSAIIGGSDNFGTIGLWGKAYNLGKEMRDDKVRRNETMCRDAADTEWTVGDGRKAAAIVLYGGSNSLMFKSLEDEVDNGIVFRRCYDGSWKMSLYNVKDDSGFHCGRYLEEKYGGGGHEGAAGATITEEQFIEMLKNKTV